MKKISIMIIDDHTLIRDIWALLLNLNNYEVVGDSGGGFKAIDVMRKARPDMVLLDINMTPVNGFEMLKQIRKFLPGTKVIGVSIHAQPAYAKKMIRGGAKGYVTKNSSSAELLLAIEEVSQGRVYLCNEVKNLLVLQTLNSDDVASRINSLSKRQLEIISYIREGLSSKQIAGITQIAASTVQVHRQNLLKILNVKNSASLIELINEYGL